MTTSDTPSSTPPKRHRIRTALLWGGPILVLAVSAYAYLASGRYIDTENAYVKANKVMISPQVSAPIAEVSVAENSPVEKGAVLLRLDRAPFEIALAQADAHLEQARAAIEALKSSYREKGEQIALARIDIGYADRDFKRQQELIDKKIVSLSTFDGAHHKLDVARQQLAVLRQDRAQILARLGGNADIPIERHPDYLQAQAQRRQAKLDLDHTVVTAPFSGIASKVPETGQYAEAGKPVISVVADRGIWIEANFKETDLTHVVPGQTVTIGIDTYPDRRWEGTVASISQATGAEFSVLPAQNSTGNWVKVVQRIPVRIAIQKRPGDPALRAGMSAAIEIDTGYRRPLPPVVALAVDWLGLTTAAAEPTNP